MCLGHFLIDDVFPVDQLLQLQQNCVFKLMDKIRELTAPELDLILGKVPSMYKASILRPWFGTHFFYRTLIHAVHFMSMKTTCHMSHGPFKLQASSYKPHSPDYFSMFIYKNNDTHG